MCLQKRAIEIKLPTIYWMNFCAMMKLPINGVDNFVFKYPSCFSRKPFEENKNVIFCHFLANFFLGPTHDEQEAKQYNLNTKKIFSSLNILYVPEQTYPEILCHVKSFVRDVGEDATIKAH